MSDGIHKLPTLPRLLVLRVTEINYFRSIVKVSSSSDASGLSTKYYTTQPPWSKVCIHAHEECNERSQNERKYVDAQYL